MKRLLICKHFQIIVCACIHTEYTFYTQQLRNRFNGLLTFYVFYDLCNTMRQHLIFPSHWSNYKNLRYRWNILYIRASKVISLEDAIYFIMQPILSPRVVLRKLCNSECNPIDHVDVQDVRNKILVLCITRRKYMFS